MFINIGRKTAISLKYSNSKEIEKDNEKLVDPAPQNSSSPNLTEQSLEDESRVIYKYTYIILL